MHIHKKYLLTVIMTCLFVGTVLIPTIQSEINDEEKDDFADPEYHTFYFNNTTREYWFYLPDSIEPDAPLLFVLHGYTGTAWGMMNYVDMNSIADENGFAVCYPQGALDNFGITHWNARLNISSVDDIGFLSALAGFLQSEYDLSDEKTFSCGFSNGGFMSYTLACEASNIFKAIASVSGTMSGYTWDNRNISEPIPILHIHGTNDTVVPINGSMSEAGGWGGAPHVDTIIEYWANRSNCTVLETEFFPSSTNASFHRGGINRNEIWYYKISNWGHAWPFPSDNTGTNASEVIWDFFHMYMMSFNINQSHFDRGFPIRHAIDGDWAAAQSFLPTFNTLTNIEIYVRKFGTPEFNLTVELRSDHPEGPLLDSLVFSPEQTPSSWKWFHLDFTDTLVSNNSQYFIVCPPAPGGVTTSFGYEWGYAFGDHYDDGSFWFTRDGGGLWRDLPTMYEFCFSTHGYY